MDGSDQSSIRNIRNRQSSIHLSQAFALTAQMFERDNIVSPVAFVPLHRAGYGTMEGHKSNGRWTGGGLPTWDFIPFLNGIRPRPTMPIAFGEKRTLTPPEPRRSRISPSYRKLNTLRKIASCMTSGRREVTPEVWRFPFCSLAEIETIASGLDVQCGIAPKARPYVSLGQSVERGCDRCDALGNDVPTTAER